MCVVNTSFEKPINMKLYSIRIEKVHSYTHVATCVLCPYVGSEANIFRLPNQINQFIFHGIVRFFQIRQQHFISWYFRFAKGHIVDKLQKRIVFDYTKCRASFQHEFKCQLSHLRKEKFKIILFTKN